MKFTKLLPLLVAGGIGAQAHANVFISEYIEGSSNNKAIEIYNAGTDSISLDGYVLQIYSNGKETASLNLELSGNLASSATYVIGHSQADAAIINLAQITSSIGFNGDDAIMLRNDLGDLVDVIGQFGVDPGRSWSANGVSTQNATIRRKSNIEAGDVNANDEFDPSLEWNAFDINTFDGLGSHTTDSTVPVDPPVEPEPPSDGELVAPCFNCPDLSPVADPTQFDADAFYANIRTAIASLPDAPSDADIAQIKALINDASQANHVRLQYSQVWSALTATDEDPDNKDNVILIYSGRSIAKFDNGSGSQSTDQDNWNREHSWPSSHGFGNRSEVAYTDIHHLRPSDISVNSTRGNKDFDVSDNAIDEAPGSRVDNDSFEPRDLMKGDVARMMLYMDTRYEGEQGEDTPDLFLVDRLTSTSENALGKLCVLLKWNAIDPIDETEIKRHDRIYQYQGNRNPYVDNPSWIDLIYPEGTCSSVVGPGNPPVDPPVDPPIDPPVEPPITPPTTNNSPLILSTVFDGTLSGGTPKGFEIYVAKDIPDLSVCGVGSANNGGGSDGQEFTFPADSASVGDFIYVASETDNFVEYFGFAPNYTDSAANVNGDDAIELFCNGDVVDLYGDIDKDGSGTPWEYLDSYAKRINNTGASATFNPDNWVFAGRNVLDGVTTGAQIGLGSFKYAQADLFISEYVEGGGFNKIIEIVNISGRTIDLSQYAVEGYQNSSTSVSYSIALSGMLADKSVFVLAHDQANLPPLDVMLQLSGQLGFNGDDSVLLMKGSEVVDAIGQAGVRPSGQWGTGLVSTKDNTLRRKLSVTRGDTNAFDEFDPALEWDGFAKDTLDDIGLYAGFGSGQDPVDINDAATLISLIQGSGDTTPLADVELVIEGVVTLVSEPLGGFFIQEEASDQDADANTSEALFVFLNGLPMPQTLAGDTMRVKGVAGEQFGKTQIVANEFAVVNSGGSVPQTPFVLPLLQDSNLEAVENMLMVNLNDLVVTGTPQYARLGEVVVASERLFVPTHLYLPDSPEAIALAAQNESNQFILDDLENGLYNAPSTFGEFSSANTLRTGTVITSSTFVMDYGFGAFRLRPAGDVNYIANQRPAAPSLEGNVKVASYNVLNLFNGDGNGEGFPTSRGGETFKEYQEQLDKIVEALVGLDASVIGLMEIENDGFGPQSSIAQLTDALNVRYGDDVYRFVNAGPPEEGSDAIANGILYNTNTVSLADDVKILNSSNSITDEDGPLFDTNRNRPSLAQTFTVNETGTTFVVNVNHLKSKGGSCGQGDDSVNGQGSCNLTRTRAAQALHVWLASTFADQPIMIIGDLNAYAQEDPIITLNNAGYADIARASTGSQTYTYSFENRFGTLDYVLANAKAQALITGVAVWHINSDEPKVFEYNDSFSRTSIAKPLAYEDSSQYRSSDHDPVVVGLTFEIQALLGDANGNGVLDYSDYFIIGIASRAHQRSGGDYDESYDLNKDGNLNRDDLIFWRALYRASNPISAGASGRTLSR